MFSPKPQENSCEEQETAKGVNVAKRSSEVVTKASLHLARVSVWPPPERLWWSGGRGEAEPGKGGLERADSAFSVIASAPWLRGGRRRRSVLASIEFPGATTGDPREVRPRPALGDVWGTAAICVFPLPP